MNFPASSARMSAWLEQAWLGRYLDRELTDEESAWFEGYVLDKPELLKEIDADTAVRDASAIDRGRSAFAESDTRAELAAPSPSTAASPSSPRIHGRFPPWLAVAASLLLGIGLGRLHWSPEDTTQSQTSNSAQSHTPNPTRIYFDVLRGENSIPPQIEINDERLPWIAVLVPVPEGARDAVLKIDGTEIKPLDDLAQYRKTFLVPRILLAKPTLGYLTFTIGTNREPSIKLDFPKLTKRPPQ